MERLYSFLILLIATFNLPFLLEAQDSATYYFQLGNSPIEVKDHCERLHYLDRAIALNPCDHYYFIRAGARFAFIADIPGAISDYRSAIRACSKDSLENRQAYYGELGFTLQIAGQCREAIRCLRRSYRLRLKAKYVYDQSIDGWVYRKKLSKADKLSLVIHGGHSPDDLRDSLKIYKKSIRKFDKDHTNDLYALANVAQQYFALGRFTKAFETIDHAILLYPNSYLGYYYRAQMKMGRGDVAAMDLDFKKAAELGFPYPLNYNYPICTP